ncbi:MAG: toprim domain-containing protein [Bacilli bacterium]|nr:toprim domain-containing protein [Bacilli bacterium]MBR3119736.1 toprim domain-containing protein [Oceanobacillus sp.]
MAQHYPSEFIEELKQRANIVDIMSQYIQVEQMGHSHLAICPFHDDQTPSMQVNSDNNTFYCHACGAGSKNHSEVTACDVISFLKHINNITFGESVEMLASMVGIPLPQLSPEEQAAVNQKREYFNLMSRVSEAFHMNLCEHQRSLQYLGNRGITHLDMKVWKLGYGGKEPHSNFINVKNRIVFPMFNYHGEIVSFTGRVPFGQSVLNELNVENKSNGKSFVPKYKDMKNFDKRNHLYGMHIAKEYIREAKTAVIVEGWTDVISLHRHGLKHAVSTMGVALSQAQIELLKRAGAKKVILMRDGRIFFIFG